MKKSVFLFTIIFLAPLARAESLTVTMNKVTPQGIEDNIGTVELTDEPKGLQFKLNLRSLPPGQHGFHIHEKPACSPGMKEGKTAAAIEAGDHFDPANTKKHLGPVRAGHGGDLPVVTVAPDGSASETLYAPRLTLAEVRNRSLMLHEGGDNYSDSPAPLGGGGARIACGVIQ